jgi:hypothetical protein
MMMVNEIKVDTGQRLADEGRTNIECYYKKNNKKRSPLYSFPVMFARNSLYDSNTHPGTIKRLNYDARLSTVTRIIQ